MQPTLYPGEVLLWASAVYEWGLHADDDADDVTKAQVHIRKQIISEMEFLKKYVPGFEKAHLAGIAPFLGIREGRHPIGEYVLTYNDLLESRKFTDAALRPVDHIRVKTDSGLRLLDVEVPYRSFLARDIDNLLLAGDAISAEHAAQFYATHLFPLATSAGEVAGVAAGLSIQQNRKVKQLSGLGQSRPRPQEHLPGVQANDTYAVRGHNRAFCSLTNNTFRRIFTVLNKDDIHWE